MYNLICLRRRRVHVTAKTRNLGEKVKFIRGLNLMKNYLIDRKDKFGLILNINVSTFNFWVSYAPESVASY